MKTIAVALAVFSIMLFGVIVLTPDGTVAEGNPSRTANAQGAAGCCLGKRGNVDGTGIIELVDLSALVSYLTGGSFVPPCYELADVDANGTVELRDLSALVNYLTGGNFILLDCPSTGQYATSDLSGTWQDNALASGPGAPWWRRGSFDFASDGSFHTRLAVSSSPTQIDSSFSGILKVSPTGIVFYGSDSSAGSLNTGHMDADKTIFASSLTWYGGAAAGTTQMDIFAKIGTSYSQGDLTGTWELNSLASGPGAPWWERGTVTIAPDGDLNGIVIQNNGEPDTLKQIPFLLSPNGVVSGSFVLDAGKTVMIGTETWTGDTDPGTTCLQVLTKRGSGYSLADLVGTWEGTSLASGSGEPWRTRSTLTISANGEFKSIQTGTGTGGAEVDSISGDLSISSAGLINISNANPTLRACLDAGKTVLVGTSMWTLDSPGTTELSIYTKIKK